MPDLSTNMSATNSSPPVRRLAYKSVLSRMLNVLVTPGEVFDEVLAGPPCFLNWLIPTLLVCLAGIALLSATTTSDQAAASVAKLTAAGKVLPLQGDALCRNWQTVSAFGICLAAAAGTCWSAFLLWFIGRVFLKTGFAYGKALEIVGLSSVVLLLGTVITGLLVAALGDPAARPALSLLAPRLPAESQIRAVLDTFNLFHFWSAGVLVVGLSKLSGVGVRESAFWVFSYWVVLRLTLVVLA